MGVLDLFTSCAQQAISRAQAEARHFKHPYIGTEHLLLGLVGDEVGVAGRVFAELGVTMGQARTTIEQILGYGPDQVENVTLELSSSAWVVIDYAIEEGRRQDQTTIGTEYLLLGLIHKDEGTAAGILKIMGVNLEQIRTSTRWHATRAIAALEDQGSQSPTPYLDALSTDLTSLAAAGRLDIVVGRQQEIDRVIHILSRRSKNNPALIGEPGVGKTAIIEGLAQRIVSGQVPETLIGRRVVALDIGGLVAGTKYRGQFEERLRFIVDEVKHNQCILFIDEFHTIVGAGGGPEGALDAANILKPALSRGEHQTIGATTLEEYRKYIEADPALERRFQPVMVDEPSSEDTLDILRGLKPRYEDFHKVRISDDILKAAVSLAVRYIPDRFLPDKAIDLIDEAAARVRVAHATRSATGLRTNTTMYTDGTAPGSSQQDLVAEMRAKLDNQPHITEGDLVTIVGLWTGIPVRRLQGDELTRLLQMEAVLRKRVIGQAVAVEAVISALWRAYAGLTDPKRPIASFMFMGPTGVGKTELAKTLAEFMFGAEDHLIRIDMSEFQQGHTIARLVGSPAGYVGYGDGGQLTEAVRRRPYSVVLFDEIEKAHPDVFNLLLQVLDEGMLSDSKGRRVNFHNTIIILTSNVGVEPGRRGGRLGFGVTADNREPTDDDMQHQANELLKQVFRPEFINRLDGKIIFHPLTTEHIQQIARKMVKGVQTRLQEHNIILDVRDDTYALLAEHGYDPAFGARPLRRAITTLIEDPLSKDVVTGRFRSGDTIVVDTIQHPNGKTMVQLRSSNDLAHYVRGNGLLSVCVITVNVTDMDLAIDFYCNKVGFEIRSKKYFPYIVELRHQDIPLVLSRVTETLHVNYPNVAQTVLGIQTENLNVMMKDLRSKGVDLVYEEPQAFPGGMYSAFRDPFGNVHELIEAH